jgi:hypothetical protein
MSPANSDAILLVLAVMMFVGIVAAASAIAVIARISKEERRTLETWPMFTPQNVVQLEAGRYRIWLDVPRRMVGALLDPDISSVRVFDVETRVALRVTGIEVWSSRRMVRRHRYVRASFTIERAGTYGIELVLGKDRRAEEIRMKLAS